ncbi:MAG: HD domain-containing protein [Oscillospiraceae bacterium]|nr:HD domain-containing protein [Oscillospiraceae bacterium]
MRVNVNEFLISLSRTLDFAEKGVLRNNYNHGMRVAYIAGRIALALSMPAENLFDLISYSLLHDNGVMKALLESPSREQFSTETSPSHCEEGEKNIATFPFLKREKNVILYHHEHYDGSGFFGIHGREIPMYSRVISLADQVAVRYAYGYTSDEIIVQINKEARIFDPVVREAFLEMSRYMEFWLGMDDMFVQSSLVAMLPQVQRDLNLQNIRSISQIFSNIIDAKSPFTGSHSRGISEKVGLICQYYEFDEATYWKMRIAADLHDLGKLAVPNEILDKPGKLDSKEFRVIQSHPFYTRKVLEMIKGFEDITEWASNHHEKLNGTGYPYGIEENQLDFNSRILACVDIYQALTEDRPYRRGMAHTDAVKIMGKMADDHLIESSVVEDISSIFP